MAKCGRSTVLSPAVVSDCTVSGKNAVGPDIVEDSTAYFSYFPGHVPVTMSRVTQAYVKSILGGQTGQIYKVL